MKKIILAAAFATAAFAPIAASAQEAAADWTFTGNAGLFSDYKFRGFTQTNYKPAFQGGFDLAHSSGLYVGNWNSNVEQGLFNGATLEMDFYGGYKGTIGDFSYDIGNIYYYYPGSGSNGTQRIRNDEVYVGGGYGPISAKVYYSLTKFFELGNPPNGDKADTKGSYYIDVSAAQPLDDFGAVGWGLNAHVGYQKVEKYKDAFDVPHDSVVDWKIGVTKDFSGWIAAVSVLGTTHTKFFTTADSGFTKGAGKTRPMISLSKAF
ncbi:TorF family putative porin [soil metagenome]